MTQISDDNHASRPPRGPPRRSKIAGLRVCEKKDREASGPPSRLGLHNERRVSRRPFPGSATLRGSAGRRRRCGLKHTWRSRRWRRRSLQRTRRVNCDFAIAALVADAKAKIEANEASKPKVKGGAFTKKVCVTIYPPSTNVDASAAGPAFSLL